MKFFIDQNVPAAVDRFLGSRGYEVVLLRERIPTESSDALVAAVAEANNAILVTFDPDFKALASRIRDRATPVRKIESYPLRKMPRISGGKADGGGAVAHRARMGDRERRTGQTPIRRYHQPNYPNPSVNCVKGINRQTESLPPLSGPRRGAFAYSAARAGTVQWRLSAATSASASASVTSKRQTKRARVGLRR